MGLQIPGILASLLSAVSGMKWPEGDETKTFDNGKKWMEYCQQVEQCVGKIEQIVGGVLQNNKGPAMEAFSKDFRSAQGVLDVVKKLAQAGNVLGAILMVVGAIIICLKGVFIANLISCLAQIQAALAAAAATFGASLAWIPIAKQLCAMLLEQAVGMAIQKVVA